MFTRVDETGQYLFEDFSAGFYEIDPYSITYRKIFLFLTSLKKSN